MQQQLEQNNQLPPIKLQPLISYPTTAQVGKTYLMTIDVQLGDTDAVWPYPEEEYEISFLLDLHPYFSYKALSTNEPTIILHRFGGTYGPAEFLLTANTKQMPKGEISITFLNASGLPMAYFELPCEIQQEVETKSELPHVKVTAASIENVYIPPASPTQSTHTETYAYIKKIEQQLQQVGWTIIEYERFKSRAWSSSIEENLDPLSISCAAVKALPSHPFDYVLIIEDELVGFVKMQYADESLTEAARSISSDLLTRDLDIACKYVIIPCIYEASDTKIQFTNLLEINPQCRTIYTFHRPKTLHSWIDSVPDIFASSNNLFRSRLQNIPLLMQGTLRSYQFEGLQAIEQSLAQQHSRTLIQMITGQGKTHTLIHSINRLLRYANAKHILYIVDIPVAKRYAMNSFEWTEIVQDEQDNLLKIKTTLANMYNVQLVDTHTLDPTAHIYVALLEDIYPLLAETQSTSVTIYDSGPLPIKYHKSLPIEYFDVIVLAESEHIKYSSWKPLLEYFDAPIIGIADNVTDAVFDFFHQNLVYPSPKSKEEVYKQLSNTIFSVYDLMRGEIDASSYLPQITWLLLLKNLDDLEMAQEEVYGETYTPIIEEPYRWRDWVDNDGPKNQRTGDDLIKFVNNDLISYLKTLSGESNHNIRTIVGSIFKGTFNILHDGYILRDVINKLNTINFNASYEIDAISLLYETMFKTMHDSDGNFGEFYTPHPVVRFIIDCLNPQLGEHILDPACGTASFLVEAYTRMSQQVITTEQQQILFDSLIGIEKKPIPYLLAIMNMLLHGIENPNISEKNALTTNINQFFNDDRVAIIATNPPFGGREDDDIISNFPTEMRTRETYLLFLQYIMALLKRPSGRAGVVMPNGFLFHSGVARTLKEKLLKQCNLHTIIRLPDGVFSPYTNIPTNILFFETGDDIYSAKMTTQEIWYYEILVPEGRSRYTKSKPIQDEDFQACIDWWDERAENTHAWKVSIDEIIKRDYNLDFKNPYSRQDF